MMLRAVIVVMVGLAMMSPLTSRCSNVYSYVGKIDAVSFEAWNKSEISPLYITDPCDTRIFGNDFQDNNTAFAGEREFLAKIVDKNTIRITPLVLNKKDMDATVSVAWCTIDPTVKDSKGEYNYVTKTGKIGETYDIVLPEGYDYFIVGTIYPDKNNVSGYVGRVNGKVQLFRKDWGIENRAKWEQALNHMDEKQAMSRKIEYPVPGVNLTKQTEDLVDSIVDGKERELGRKLYDKEIMYLVSKYIVENYAYDSFVVYNARIKDRTDTRAKIMGDVTNVNHYMINNNVGVCYDFAGTLGIAARHIGLPSCMVVFRDKGSGVVDHGSCAVKLDGYWVQFDVTDCMKYSCDKEDTSKSGWKEKMQQSFAKKVNCCPNLDRQDIEAFSYNFYSGHSL